jgi:endonuclease/exonuclease/phosphatase (EEP) superfamily protein YafD
VPSLHQPLMTVALHAFGPETSTARWQRDMSGFKSELPKITKGSPAIVGGDFNATTDEVQFRNLLDAGFSDAVDQSGAGYTPTYPADRWFGPLIGIDHVLTRNGPVATDVHSVEIPGTDHRALVATIAVPRN